MSLIKPTVNMNEVISDQSTSPAAFWWSRHDRCLPHFVNIKCYHGDISQGQLEIEYLTHAMSRIKPTVNLFDVTSEDSTSPAAFWWSCHDRHLPHCVNIKCYHGDISQGQLEIKYLTHAMSRIKPTVNMNDVISEESTSPAAFWWSRHDRHLQHFVTTKCYHGDIS